MQPSLPITMNRRTLPAAQKAPGLARTNRTNGKEEIKSQQQLSFSLEKKENWAETGKLILRPQLKEKKKILSSTVVVKKKEKVTKSLLADEGDSTEMVWTSLSTSFFPLFRP